MERFSPNRVDWERYYINQAKNIVQTGNGYGVTSIKHLTPSRNTFTSGKGRTTPSTKTQKIANITFKKTKQTNAIPSAAKKEGAKSKSLTNKKKSGTVNKKTSKAGKKTAVKRNLNNKRNKLSNIFL